MVKTYVSESKAKINFTHLLTKPNDRRMIPFVTKQAVSEAARLLGSRTSPKKAKSSRENGKLGGRPKKKKTKAA